MSGTGDGGRSGGLRRRQLLRHGVAALAGGAAVVSLARPVAGQSGGFGEWFDGVGNYDGVVERTGESEVAVSVGASGNGGNFAFGPPAIRVDPGTTVTWEWTGEGGEHNVVSDGDGPLESDLVGEDEHTYSHTFEESGVYRYVCTPHESVGMKGAVVVGDIAVGGSGGAVGSVVEILQTAADENPLVFVIYTILGFGCVLALIPEFVAAPRVLGNAFQRAGYRVKRPVLFRRRPLGSMLAGWATFLAVLTLLAAFVIGAWVVTGGGPAFLAVLFAFGAILALYVASTVGVSPLPDPAPTTMSGSATTASRRTATTHTRSSRGIVPAPGRTLRVVRAWGTVALLFAVVGAVVVAVWHLSGGGLLFLACLSLVALALAAYVVDSIR